MPPALLTAYSERLPRLMAEESLQAAERMAVGTGSLKKGAGQRISRQWIRAADQRREVVTSSGPQGYAAHMAQVGIAVKKVPRA